MNNFFLKTGAILGALGVAIGAFGAHALKASLQASNHFDTFETAVRYQFYHALALILVGILANNFKNKLINYSGYCFIIGTIIFCGALYTICFTGINLFGAVAPIGGLFMILGWVSLFLGVNKK
jgi:uncharacterized membrane protein YgdD (TMEM256/DUF423 family)